MLKKENIIKEDVDVNKVIKKRRNSKNKNQFPRSKYYN